MYHTLLLHGIKSIEIGDIKEHGPEISGSPYAERKIVLHVKDGYSLELNLFSDTAVQE